jgi:hypothetical protein
MFIMQDTPSGNDAWATFQNASLGFLVINNLLTMLTKLTATYTPITAAVECGNCVKGNCPEVKQK